MTFNDVLRDIEKLIGLELHSIRPGANIVVLSVDEAKGCLILRTSQGQTKSRPISELQTIWDEMIKNKAVHIEGVLHGSGTSRNQPETIFANLPYVEWLKISNKKHLAFVGKNTHAYGTLKQMDSVAAAQLTEEQSGVLSDTRVQFVIVSSDVQAAISEMQSSVTGTVSAIEPGIYSFLGNGLEALYIVAGKCSLSPGCYTVINAVPTSAYTKVEICDEEYFVIETNAFRALIKSR